MREGIGRGFSRCAGLVLAVLVGSGGIARGDRLELPVVLTGDQLPLWSGEPVADVYALIFEATSQTWAAIPYQIDERVWLDLATCLDDPGYGNVDAHLSYAFDGVEGNGLDLDDEIVFLAGDAAGDRASLSAWPAGTDDARYEVRIDDGLGATLGYAYLFTAATPPTPPDATDYVDLGFAPIDETLEDTAIATDRYIAHYSGRWRLDALAVPPAAGGSGTDLIDRLKFREATSGNATGGETEETWDQLSCFLGQKDGPVRVLREVQGAASGVNTSHTLSFYAALFQDRVNLRVHAIPNVVSYVDYNASIAAGGLLTYYNATNPLGVTIDGVVDPGLDTTLQAWETVSHPSAGAIFFHRVFFEDASFSDTTGDDEPGRYGCHGVFLSQIASTDEPGDEAVIVQTTWPLPAGSGNLGASLAEEIEAAPFGEAQVQYAPEPGSALLLAIGAGVLQLLQRARQHGLGNPSEVLRRPEKSR
jgi:hypothetical protein